LNSDRVLHEIDFFVNSGVNDIAVLDPIFNSGPNYMDILKHFSQNNFEGRLSLQCRFEMVNDEFLALCKKLNVRLEFGLQTIHKEEMRAINRANNIAKVLSVMKKLNDCKIVYEVSIIFGLPLQTLSLFKATVDFCLQNGVPVLKAFPLMLLRGTKLELQRDLYGLVENKEIIPSVIASNTFSELEWKQMAAISDLLLQTEGNHPRSSTDLDQRENLHITTINNDGKWSPTFVMV